MDRRARLGFGGYDARGLLARESASGADLEPVYRALYLGLACGLVRTKVSPSQMPFRESYSA